MSTPDATPSQEEPQALSPSLSGREGRFIWKDQEIWYTQQGSGPPLLLVHAPGVGGSSLEWAANMKGLSHGHTLYALDLLGFGQSSKPLLHYTGSLYAGLLRDFWREVIGKPADVLASGQSCAFAVGAAVEEPDAFVRLVLVCPTGLRPLPHIPGRQDPSLFHRLISPHGNALYDRIASRPSLLYQLQTELYYDQRLVTPELVEQHYAAAHQGAGCRYAPAAFLAGHLDWNVRESYSGVHQPVLLVWGEQAAHNPPVNLVDFLAANPGAVGRVFANARLRPHAEHPARFNQACIDFLLARC